MRALTIITLIFMTQNVFAYGGITCEYFIFTHSAEKVTISVSLNDVGEYFGEASSTTDAEFQVTAVQQTNNGYKISFNEGGVEQEIIAVDTGEKMPDDEYSVYAALIQNKDKSGQVSALCYNY